MVGPTCTSLICAMVNPCKALGRFGSFTSTSTTRARRLAFSNPTSVASAASDTTSVTAVT